jgi:hypothetical protein
MAKMKWHRNNGVMAKAWRNNGESEMAKSAAGAAAWRKWRETAAGDNETMKWRKKYQHEMKMIIEIIIENEIISNGINGENQKYQREVMAKNNGGKLITAIIKMNKRALAAHPPRWRTFARCRRRAATRRCGFAAKIMAWRRNVEMKIWRNHRRRRALRWRRVSENGMKGE